MGCKLQSSEKPPEVKWPNIQGQSHPLKTKLQILDDSVTNCFLQNPFVHLKNRDTRLEQYGLSRLERNGALSKIYDFTPLSILIVGQPCGGRRRSQFSDTLSLLIYYTYAIDRRSVHRLELVFMNRIIDEVLSANRIYRETFGTKGLLAMPPARRFAILTCMDARLDPAKFAGVAEGDAHIIRNAGGRASDDAIRSLVISYKLLGTREWFVIHHTDCGMETFSDEVIRGLLSRSLEQAVIDSEGWHDHGRGPGSDAGEFVDWLTIKDTNASVVTDVRRIRTHPLVPPTIPIYGYLYDVRSGALLEVPDATAIGAADAKA
jgi:carbonic anhydrase